MEWLSQIDSVLKNPIAGQVLNSALGIKAPSAPKAPPKSPSPVIAVQNPVSPGMSKSTMAMIGVGVLAIAGAIFYFARKKS